MSDPSLRERGDHGLPDHRVVGRGRLLRQVDRVAAPRGSGLPAPPQSRPDAGPTQPPPPCATTATATAAAPSTPSPARPCTASECQPAKGRTRAVWDVPPESP